MWYNPHCFFRWGSDHLFFHCRDVPLDLNVIVNEKKKTNDTHSLPSWSQVELLLSSACRVAVVVEKAPSPWARGAALTDAPDVDPHGKPELELYR